MITTDHIFSISNEQEFESLALEVFRYQAQNCEVYSTFVKHLGIEANRVMEISKIPFLPIEFFKTHEVILKGQNPEITFNSSGTTGSVQSRHLVSDTKVYIQSYRQAFSFFYGDIKNYSLLALLPSYQERDGSSLIFMVDDLIEQTNNLNSGYFLYEHHLLEQKLQLLHEAGQPTLLIGVTYALLDFAESCSLDFPQLIVMETGGMKGRRKEMIRAELHGILCNGFGTPVIHSEYGMTELLSQAYSKGGGIFHSPPWLKAIVRDTNDPLSLLGLQQTGGLNFIDLANINSCSFIATQDLGKTFADGTFEVLGRFDNSDIRGCNLLVQ